MSLRAAHPRSTPPQSLHAAPLSAAATAAEGDACNGGEQGLCAGAGGVALLPDRCIPGARRPLLCGAAPDDMLSPMRRDHDVQTSPMT